MVFRFGPCAYPPSAHIHGKQEFCTSSNVFGTLGFCPQAHGLQLLVHTKDNTKDTSEGPGALLTTLSP